MNSNHIAELNILLAACHSAAQENPEDAVVNIDKKAQEAIQSAIDLATKLQNIKRIVPEEKVDMDEKLGRCGELSFETIGWNACRQEVALRVVAFGKRLEEIIWQLKIPGLVSYEIGLIAQTLRKEMGIKTNNGKSMSDIYH